MYIDRQHSKVDGRNRQAATILNLVDKLSYLSIRKRCTEQLIGGPLLVYIERSTTKYGRQLSWKHLERRGLAMVDFIPLCVALSLWDVGQADPQSRRTLIERLGLFQPLSMALQLP